MSITTMNSTRSRGVPMLIALVVFSAVGPNAYAAAAPATSVPKSLVDAAEYGETVYDYAQAKDWKHTDATLRSLEQAAKKMHAEVADQATAEGRVDATIATL